MRAKQDGCILGVRFNAADAGGKEETLTLSCSFADAGGKEETCGFLLSSRTLLSSFPPDAASTPRGAGRKGYRN
jgi:hypothetical protein